MACGMLRSSLAAGLLLNVSTSVSAQAPTIRVGTGIDKQYEMIGIRMGMSCEYAAISIGAETRKPTRPPVQRRFEAGPPSARKAMDGMAAFATLSDAAPIDRITVSCTGKATGNIIFRIERVWEFAQNRPTIDQFKQQIESKYGRFRSTFTNSIGNQTFGMLVNEAGRVSGPDDSCGAFSRNTPEAALQQIANNPDPARCAFAFTLSIESAGSKDEVSKARLVMFDYKAFAEALEAEAAVEEARRKQAIPPKLKL